MEAAVNDKADQFEFVRGNLMALPYDPNTGAYKADTLVQLYNRLKQEGLWETVFHEHPDMSMVQFLNLFQSPRFLLLIFSLIEPTENRVIDTVGMAWVGDVTNCGDKLSRGVGSFVFFRDYQKPMYTDLFGAIALEYWFEVLGLDLLIGVTPATNRAALLYVKRAGLREIARLPGYTVLNGQVTDAIITYLKKDEYMETQYGRTQ